MNPAPSSSQKPSLLSNFARMLQGLLGPKGQNQAEVTMSDLIKKGKVRNQPCYYEVPPSGDGMRWRTLIPGRFVKAEREAKGEKVGKSSCQERLRHDTEDQAKDHLKLRMGQIWKAIQLKDQAAEDERLLQIARRAHAMIKSKGYDITLEDFVEEFMPNIHYVLLPVREFFRRYLREVHMKDIDNPGPLDGASYWNNIVCLYRKLPPSILDKAPSKVDWSTEFNPVLSEKGNKKSTIAANRRYLHTVFEHFTKRSFILTNPADFVPRSGRLKSHSRRGPTSVPDHSPLELVTLLDFTLAKAPELYPAIILLIGSCARCQEIANYRWEYFNPGLGSVGVPEFIQKGEGTFYHANYLPRGLFVRLQAFFKNDIPRNGYVVALDVPEDPKDPDVTYNARKKAFSEKLNVHLFNSTFKKMEGREENEKDREPIRKLGLSMLKALGANINFIAHFAGHMDKETTIDSYIYRLNLRKTQDAYLNFYPSDYLDNPETFTPDLAYKESPEYLDKIGQSPSAAASTAPPPSAAPSDAPAPTAPPTTALPAPQAPAASKGKKPRGLSPG
ncbi:MAG: hypothetical protein SFU85_08845 [Candidatus Methylacidiphilales bacterium]|nr:hypothetical protein [Candidatus Methylacidiphilales bacterium]